MNEVNEEKKKYVALWLFVIAGMIFAMVVLGGLTRLTESGLSMVDWRPLMGAVPPTNEHAWNEVFEAYKQYPEYQKLNHGMSLSEFKFIFFMEYAHRLLGRLIGLTFFLPLLWFAAKRIVRGRFLVHLVVLFMLGGLQGVVGWYMVKSGLVDHPEVSQYRLTLHLCMALLVLSLSLWHGFGLTLEPASEDAPLLGSLKTKVLALTALLGCQIISGGFVAGLKAGYASNTWPKMNGHWVPEGLFTYTPAISNFFDNPVMVQFFHRTLALFVATALLWFAFAYRGRVRNRGLRLGLTLLILAVCAQVLMGIGTIVMNVPVALASAHQAGALILWSIMLFINHQTTRQQGLRPETVMPAEGQLQPS